MLDIGRWCWTNCSVVGTLVVARLGRLLICRQIGHQVKFYKSRSQEKNLSRGRNFSYFAAHVNEQDLF
jgi:hypothetical protein